MKFLLKYPSRERPELFKQRVMDFSNFGSGRHLFRWVFTFDADDKTMNNPQMTSWIKNNVDDYFIGLQTSPGKISAVNAHVNENLEDADILCIISDDMVPQVSDWDDLIVQEMMTHYPNLDGAIHINDGLQGIRLCTFSVLGRKLYDHFGYFYHPDYVSTHCDDEYTNQIWRLRRAVYIPEVWVKHDWVGHVLNDELHQRNHNLMSADGNTFIKRANAGFPKRSVLT